MTALNPIELQILRLSGWRVRVWVAVAIFAVLTTLPLRVSSIVLWLAALPYLGLIETLACMVGECHRARRLLEVDHEEQATLLVEREARIAHLESELANAQAAIRRSANTTGDPVYRRVGLSPSAPNWLVQAARTAYRRRLHPDMHPPRHRQQAHDCYIRAEEAFERIERLRG